MSIDIPLANSSAVLFVTCPFTFILPVINVVPVGTVSFTFTVVGAVPLLLSNVIVYVISCPNTTFSVVGLADLLISTFGFFTSVVTSSVVPVSSIIAAFFISLSKLFAGSSSTVTSNVTIEVCFSFYIYF